MKRPAIPTAATKLSPLSTLAEAPILAPRSQREWLTPEQVAALIGVHPETVRIWLRSGRLAGIKLLAAGPHRRWRVSEAALAAFLAAAAVGTSGADGPRQAREEHAE